MNSKRVPLVAALFAALMATGGLLVGPSVLAADAPAVQAKTGWYSKLVTVDFVKQQAVLPKVDGVLLIDSRPAARKYDLGHIPTAVNLPDSQFDKLAAEQLPADKGAALYFYCEGLSCRLSNDSALKAIQLGYGNVKVLPEGYPAWEKAYGASAGAAGASAKAPVIEAGKEAGSIAVASFERIYREAPDSVYLIDVREPREPSEARVG